MFQMPKALQDAILSRDSFCIIGRVGMDLYPTPDGATIQEATAFQTDIGGSAGNIAVAIAKGGHKAALISGLSNDGVGQFVRNALAAYHVSDRYIATTNGQERTSLALAETKAIAPQVVIYRNHAADLVLDPRLLSDIAFAEVKSLVITGTALSNATAAKQIISLATQAAADGCPVMLDIDYRAMAWANETAARDNLLAIAPHCDVLIGNDDEFGVMGACAAKDSFAYAQKLAQDGHVILYKKGEKGCDALYGDAHFATGIYHVPLKKPFGAGDAFLGNLLNALADNAPLAEAIQKGSAAAAMVVSQAGCASAMPTKDTLEAFIAQHPLKSA